MRAGEYFHSLRLLPGAWAVIRIDGRSFTRFTEPRFDKPFDERFRDHMLTACRALMEELNGIYCFTESDEISILLPPSWSFFDREVEKIVSVSASIATAAFSLDCGEPVHFDSRIWMGTRELDVIDYFRWRQADGTRCCLNGWVYWTLRRAGMSYAEATSQLEGRSTAWKNETLYANGINFNDLPVWQKRGIGLYWKQREVDGVNPVTGESARAMRRYLYQDFEIPMKEEYDSFLLSIVEQASIA